MKTLTIKVESAYSDGHTSERVETVTVPPFADLDELWEHLQDHNGDGHGSDDPDLGYCYTITVLDFPGHPELVEVSNEWCGN